MTCKECKYFESWNMAMMEEYGCCRRFPRHENVDEGGWCGEWRRKGRLDVELDRLADASEG